MLIKCIVYVIPGFKTEQINVILGLAWAILSSQMLRWCKSKSTMNCMWINVAQWIFFWNVTRCQAILANAKYYHVLGHAVMVRKIILIIWTLSNVSQSIRIYYFTWKYNITKYHRKNMKSPSVMMLIKSYERYLQLPCGTYFTHVMMSYDTYHQLSQCQWYHLEYITKLHDVNVVRWKTPTGATMSMASGPMLTCSRPPCPGLWCPPVSTCTSSLQWPAYAGSHTTTLCHPGHQSTNKFKKNSFKSFFIWLCTNTLFLHINNTVNIHVILKMNSRTCLMWLLGEITYWPLRQVTSFKI